MVERSPDGPRGAAACGRAAFLEPLQGEPTPVGARARYGGRGEQQAGALDPRSHLVLSPIRVPSTRPNERTQSGYARRHFSGRRTEALPLLSPIQRLHIRSTRACRDAFSIPFLRGSTRRCGGCTRSGVGSSRSTRSRLFDPPSRTACLKPMGAPLTVGFVGDRSAAAHDSLCYLSSNMSEVPGSGDTTTNRRSLWTRHLHSLQVLGSVAARRRASRSQRPSRPCELTFKRLTAAAVFSTGGRAH